jgi:lysophospholipase L1-like esterase
MKRGLAKLGLLFLGATLGLGLAEAIVRVLGVAPGAASIEVDRAYGTFVSHPNPKLAYVPKPGGADINADGFRDHDYPTEKDAHTLRIVVIGDSIGFGFCNEDRAIPIEATFPKVLERELDPASFAGIDRVEVLNLSVSGYDTIQEVEFLREKGLAYDPDLVLVAYCLNDWTSSSWELYLLEKEPGWERYHAAAEFVSRHVIFKSHLARLALQSLAARADEPGRGDLVGDRTEVGFDTLATLAREEEFSTLVAIFPSVGQLSDYAHQDQHEASRAKAAARGFAVIDLLPALAEASRTTDVCTPCCDVHPNEAGHRVAAEAIAGYLQQHASALVPL